jgi:hypothetical protein
MWRPGSYESNVDSLLEPQRHITTGATFRIQLSDKKLTPSHTKGHRQFTRSTARGRVNPARNDRAVCTQPPMPPLGRSFVSRGIPRVLPSLQHVAPSAAPAHFRSFLGLPQSPVLCHFQRPP